MATIESDLKKIQAAMLRLRNKMNRVDLEYTVQLSTTSVQPDRFYYASQLSAPANGLEPLTFLGDTAEDLILQIKAYTKVMNRDLVDKAYHEGQIESAKRTIKFHEEYIKSLAEPKKDEEQADEESEK